MKHHSLSNVLKRLACVLAALVIALAVAVFALWHNELATLSSLKKLSDRDEAHRDGAVYQLNVSAGYYSEINWKQPPTELPIHSNFSL